MNRSTRSRVQTAPGRPAAPPGARRNARIRALCLLSVYLLMIVHLVHWKVSGRTLAPLELNEVMYTLELGIVTAGFLFMALAVVATLVFGRFFCGWGCHMLALQDLCAWLLRKFSMRPRILRSRLLLWVPVVALLYMFAWPQVTRVMEGRPWSKLHLATDQSGWASFITENFTRNLPGPGIMLLTFALCGFAIVIVLGSRSFCRYGCPYGVLFGLVDRLAPGRIRAAGGCQMCGTCTAHCTSHVRVHEELARYGTVVDPNCLRDLDCVKLCPNDAIRYGFGAPALFPLLGGRRGETAVLKPKAFSLPEELGLLLILVACMFIFRGLYDLVPFLMTIGLGLVVAACLIFALRVFRRSEVRFIGLTLKSDGRVLLAGHAFLLFCLLLLGLCAHSAFIRHHEFQGARLHRLVMTSEHPEPTRAAAAIAHLEQAHRFGLLSSDRTDRALVELLLRERQFSRARAPLLRRIERNRSDHHPRVQLAEIYMLENRRPEALRQLGLALRLAPDDFNAHFDLGGLLIESGRAADALPHLEKCVELHPDFADARLNLGVALAELGQFERAGSEVQRARSLNPDDPQIRAFERHLDDLKSTSSRGSAKPAGQ